MSGNYFQPIKREFLNLSGGTVTGDTTFTFGLYANSLSGGTLFSGSTNLEDIFLTSSEISGTTLSEGANIDLIQSGIDYKVSVVDSPSFNDIYFSGTSIGGNSLAVNISATTGFYSAGTSLEDIIYSIATSTEDITKVQPGTNVTTGGTETEPIVSLVDSPSVNNIIFSGVASGGDILATEISGSTFYSAGTNLYDIFLTTGDVSGTSVSAGSNVDVQQLGIDYNVSIVDSPSFNDIFYSGTSIGGNSLATNVSATTGFYSAGTSLETIIYNIANSTEDITKVQPGSNIVTGGTEAEPIVSLVDSPSVNDINFSGSAIGNIVSVSTLSASTIYSGSTNLSNIFSTHDYYTTGATFSAATKVATFNRNDGGSYDLNLSALTTVDTYVTAVTFSSTTLVLDQNEGQPRLTAPIPTTSLSGVLSSATFNIYTTGAMSASTFYGSGSGLTGIHDYYVTGGTFSGGTLTLNRQNGSFNVTGFTSGSGTSNYIPKWTSSTGLGNSLLYDNGSAVGVGTTSPDGFQVNSAVSETARGVDNVRLGVLGGTPRIIFEDSTYTQWEIDNSGGILRFFQPGVVRAQLTSSGDFQARRFTDYDDNSYYLDPSASTGTTSAVLAGNVVIGATSTTEKLEVVGRTKTTSLNVTSGATIKDLIVTGTTYLSGASTYENIATGSLGNKEIVNFGALTGYVDTNVVDTYVTGFTYNPSSNLLTIKQNEGKSDLTATINNFSSATISGLTVQGETQFNGDINVDGNVLITKNVTILGTATTINTETLSVKDNIITLNSSATGNTAPLPINSGIEVLRNSGTTTALVWEETNGYWSAGLTGSTAKIILQGDSLSLLNSGHTHPISEIVDLQSALDTKFDKSGGTITGAVNVNNSFSANSLFSGSTNLYDIFLTTADGNDITRVQPGSNITTGGTENQPIINLVSSPSINNLSFSGTATGPALSATTMSGSTLRLSSSVFVGSTSSIQWGDNGMAGTINGFLSMSSNGVFRFGDSVGGGSPTIIMGSAGAATGISLKRNGTGLQLRNGDDTAYASLSAASIVGTSVSATTITATTYSSGTTPLSSVFVNNVNAGSNVSMGGSSTQPIVNVVASPSFNNLTLSGSASFNTLIVNSTSQLNGAISSGNLSGTTDRMVQVSSGGTLSASKQIISAYIVSGGTVANILENESNWNINGDFIGSGITGTYMGQKHYNYNYFFEAIEDNQWIRLIRG